MFHVKRWSDLQPIVSRETFDRLTLYQELLLRWNSRINLVSRADEGNLWRRHILDSLQLAALVPALTERAIDLGSGAGFPGLVLSICTGIPFDLIEADQRKCAFLREAARETGAPALVHAVRIEKALVHPATLVTARALAPLPVLLDLAYRFLLPGGVALFPKGADADRELTEAGTKWNMSVERFPSRTAAHATIIKLSEVARG